MMHIEVVTCSVQAAGSSRTDEYQPAFVIRTRAVYMKILVNVQLNMLSLRGGMGAHGKYKEGCNVDTLKEGSRMTAC